jgi:mannose-1-phosphate guanylyltransferase
MAGGVGSRFWPRSREKSPKQLLNILGTGTMIQNTVSRIKPLIPAANIMIVTNKVQKSLVMKQLPEIPEDNIIVEPFGRNTAPCIGLAAHFVERRDPHAVMVVLPADHVITDEKEFLRIIKLGINIADEADSLVTIGIPPDRPETGYGYIQVIDDDDPQNPYPGMGVYRVKTFAEKPALETAKQFLASGDFFWNSGMFIWRVDKILKEIARLLPEMSAELDRIDEAFETPQYQNTLETAYHVIRGISIDYGVMEKASSVFVIKGNFGWSDVGSWDEVSRLSMKDSHSNNVTGKVFLQDTTDSIVYSSEDTFVATIGVDDLIVIATGDAVLVCKKGKSQEVKEIVDYLRRKQFNDYL